MFLIPKSLNSGFIGMFALSVLLTSCSRESKTSENTQNAGPEFIKMSAAETGVHFNNLLTEDEENNVLIYDGFYTGAGVAVLDVNNDGLQDLFFASNQGPEKLYLNKGNFKFTDISKEAGIEGGNEWSGGVTIADVNGDGWDDIYICNHMYLDPERRRNKLYINNKNNSFTERAKEFGIDDPGFSIQGSFFDYDLDGDLDLFVVNQPPNHNETRDALMATNKPDFQYSSHLYRNDGNNHFTNVTEAAGVKGFAFSLSATIGDFFNDGYPDIYVANDYDYGDYLFVNNGDGTFLNVSNYSLRHISNFSMGADAADINNDGFLDIFVADMTPEDHYRNKTNMAGMNPEKFWQISKAGNNFQYMFNTLQLNQGNGLFSEIGQMGGVAKTDWSWSPVFADFDLDGYRDLFVSNGILRDIRNRDFLAYAIPEFKGKTTPRVKIMEKAPSVPLQNYLFSNDGKLHFNNVASKSGLSDLSFSQGAAYADLDNDGDVDLIVNNMNQEAFIYNNQAVEKKKGNYLRVKLEGSTMNKKSFGARVLIAYGPSKIQMAELINTRGYMSTSEPILHFGLGTAEKVDSIFVRWPSGQYIRVDNIKANSTITIKESDAKEHMNEQLFQELPFILTDEVTKDCFDGIAHSENQFDDYKREILIPYKQSTLGPPLESGDVNGDGLEDLFLGGAANFSAQLLIQQANGKFIKSSNTPWSKYAASENIDIHLFDVDKDGDLDVYFANGSNEFPIGSPLYCDQLFVNNGKGVFTDATNRIPKLNFSKSVVRSSDFDKDGDLDLFIGGRLVPGRYGQSERSAILVNNNGQFEDKTELLIPQMAKAFECVTDAIWIDIDKDQDEDLVVVGEWAPVRIFRNDKTRFEEISSSMHTDSLFGWWSAVAKKDINNDGYEDLILGNVGLNTKFKAKPEKPFRLYASDFDGNGSWDTYLASLSPEGKLYPVRGRQCSSEQMPFISEKFKTYDQFAKASVEEILEGKMEGSTQKIATEFHSMVLINDAGKGFIKDYLPAEAQIAPVYSIAFYDFNKDGTDDILLGGNYYNREVETTRSDASVGQILINTGNGSFLALVNSVSGLKFYHDLRELRIVKGKDKTFIIGANNDEKLQAFKING